VLRAIVLVCALDQAMLNTKIREAVGSASLDQAAVCQEQTALLCAIAVPNAKSIVLPVLS
jgi:hypothetical protein